MKRKTLLGFAMLPALAMIIHHLDVAPRVADQSAGAQTPGVPEIVRVERTPESARVKAAGLEAGESKTEPGRPNETIESRAQTSVAVELPALCNSLLQSPHGSIELRQIVRSWAETNGAAAAAWASQLMQNPAQEDVLTEIALGWGRTNLPGALDWANTLPEGKNRQAAIEQLGYETARTDPMKALEVAVALEPGPRRDDLLENAISQWATKDFDAAVQWAEAAILDEALRQRLLATVAVSVAGQDGAAAATLTAKALTPGDEQDRVAVAIVQRWVQREPEQAAAWVAQFTDTPARAATVQNLVAFWAAQDQQAAANWLQGLPEGTLRDAGMAAYSQALAMTEIAAAE